VDLRARRRAEGADGDPAGGRAGVVDDDDPAQAAAREQLIGSPSRESAWPTVSRVTPALPMSPSVQMARTTG
jgi:hypothetical protein